MKSKKKYDEVKKSLQNRKIDILERIKKLSNEVKDIAHRNIDDPEIGNEIAIDEIAVCERNISAIDRALKRISHGSYGICEQCGKDIKIARLKAMPSAVLCFECASNQENG